MYCKALYLLTLTIAASSETLAQQGGGTRGAGGPPPQDEQGQFDAAGPPPQLQGGPDDNFGRQEGFGQGGTEGFHGGFGQGGGRGGPGGKKGHIDVTLVNITCSEDLSCALPNGEDGFFVCRGLHDIRTGEENFEALCIQKDKAWENVDECGCCGEDCPEQPSFQDITCDEVQNFNFPDKRHDNSNVDLAVVCRDVFSPFTGEPTEMTVPIPTNRALEGDICGCCHDTCPEEGDKPFEDPEQVEKSCTEEEFITCRPRRGGRGRPHGEGEEPSEVEGFFVCRQTYDLLTGDSKQEATCITEESAWASDECGCCGDDCPEDKSDSHVEIECLGEDMSCDLPRGEVGVFVCRSTYNPLNGEPEKTSQCIPTDKAWEGNDICGCCEETGCPETPDFGNQSGGRGGVGGVGEAPTPVDSTSFELTEGEDGASSSAVGLGAFMAAMIVAFL